MSDLSGVHKKSFSNEKLSVQLSTLGLKGSYNVTDMWANKKMGKVKGSFSYTLKPHASILVKLSR